MRLITTMSASMAKDFFLKKESYFSFDLPKYFDFSSIIKLSDNLVFGKDLKN